MCSLLFWTAWKLRLLSTLISYPCYYLFYSFDGFTSTFQDKLFKGYDMEIHNQIFYTTMCSCVLSLTGNCLHIRLILFQDQCGKRWSAVLVSVIYCTSFLFPFSGLILQNHLIPAVDFMFRHPDCFSDVVILSSVRLTYWYFKRAKLLLLCFPKNQ